MDDMKNLFTFMENMDVSTNHVSNVYVARTFSPEGECTGTYYGMNLLTDYGFAQFFGNDTIVDFPTKLYVGNGVGSFDKSTTTLLAPLFQGLAATAINTTINHGYPLFYSPGDQDDNGRITTVSRYLVCKYDENIEGVSSDVTITEYGIGSDVNSLWTHSYVYDITGQRVSMLKRTNEILEITVYFCCTFLESLIMGGYTNGLYSVITTGNLMMNHMNIPTISTFRRKDYSGNYGKYNRSISTRSKTAIVNSTITKTTSIADFDLDVNGSVNNRYIDGFSAEDTGFLILQKQTMPTESFTLTNVQTRDFDNEGGFSERFGVDILLTQMDVDDVYIFNASTGDWDIPVLYHNDPDHIYDETPMSTAYGKPLYYSNNNSVQTLYVYQNINTADPIVKIGGNLQTVYATNKYWKGLNITNNDWVLITDRDNVPLSEQNKRYWITASNSVDLAPVRGLGDFHIMETGDISHQTISDNFASQSVMSTMWPSIYNTDYHWSFQWHGVTKEIYGMDTNYFKSLTSDFDNAVIFASTFGKYLFVHTAATSSAGLWLYDTSTIPNSSLATPTALTKTGITNSLIYDTESGTGIIACSSVGKLQIIDLRQTPVDDTVVIDCTSGACVWGTNKIAYVVGSTLKIYNVDTQTDELNVPLSIYGTVRRVFAHTNYVFISTSDYTYLCDLRTSNVVRYETHVGIDTNQSSGPFVKCTSDTMTIYNSIGTNSSYASTYTGGICIVFSIADISVNKRISASDIGLASNVRGSMLFNVNGALLLIGFGISTAYETYGYPIISALDIGQLIHNDTKQYISTIKPPGLFFIYDKFMIHGRIKIPLINFLPLKITGETTTASAINNKKHVGAKSFDISFSNVPVFSGKPPGQSN